MAMGGPWRERGYDAKRWERPVARVEARVEGAGDALRERGIVFAYIASVVLSIVLLLALGRLSW
jgi:hypothetical protein